MTEGATKTPNPRCPKTFSKALSSNSATIVGRIFSDSSHWSIERRAVVLEVGSKKGAPSSERGNLGRYLTANCGASKQHDTALGEEMVESLHVDSRIDGSVA